MHLLTSFHRGAETQVSLMSELLHNSIVYMNALREQNSSKQRNEPTPTRRVQLSSTRPLGCAPSTRHTNDASAPSRILNCDGDALIVNELSTTSNENNYKPNTFNYSWEILSKHQLNIYTSIYIFTTQHLYNNAGIGFNIANVPTLFSTF